MSIFLCLHPWPQGPRAVRDKGVTQNYLVEAKAEKAPLPASVPQNPPFPDRTAEPRSDSQQWGSYQWPGKSLTLREAIQTKTRTA